MWLVLRYISAWVSQTCQACESSVERQRHQSQQLDRWQARGAVRLSPASLQVQVCTMSAGPAEVENGSCGRGGYCRRRGCWHPVLPACTQGMCQLVPYSMHQLGRCAAARAHHDCTCICPEAHAHKHANPGGQMQCDNSNNASHQVARRTVQGLAAIGLNLDTRSRPW